MNVILVSSPNEDGSRDIQWRLTEEQVTVLMNYAITSLVQQGLVSVVEQNEEDSSVLNDLDVEQMASA